MGLVELGVSLEDMATPVTRSLLVADTLRLDRLHMTLQAAMGWQDAHLYMFEGAGKLWGIPDRDFGSDVIPAKSTTVAELIAAVGRKRLIYLYDFGDSWEHLLTFATVRTGVSDGPTPRLTHAVGACPPEDCGGVPGYVMIREILSDPSHPEHAEMKDWYGDLEETCDLAALKAEVARLAKRWAPRRKA